MSRIHTLRVQKSEVYGDCGFLPTVLVYLAAFPDKSKLFNQSLSQRFFGGVYFFYLFIYFEWSLQEAVKLTL